MLFCGLAFVIGCFALGAVLTRYLLRAALYLVGVLAGSAGLYLMLGAEFLAGAQVLVYVGGVVVLLVFAIMLTRSEELLHDQPTLQRKIFGLIGAGGFFLGSIFLLKSSVADLRLPDVAAPSIAEIGRRLLDQTQTGYLIPFEVISLLLLAVLIGGVRVGGHERE